MYYYDMFPLPLTPSIKALFGLVVQTLLIAIMRITNYNFVELLWRRMSMAVGLIKWPKPPCQVVACVSKNVAGRREHDDDLYTETLSSLRVFCKRNRHRFPADYLIKWPVMWNFVDFFAVSLENLWSMKSCGRWFEMPRCSYVLYIKDHWYHFDGIWWPIEAKTSIITFN